MTNYYNSGLYIESFFTKHKHLGLDYDYLIDEMLGCNYHFDERSYLFLDFDYFEYVVGKTVTEKVLEAIDHAQ